MVETIHTVIVGGGQAGLSLSYHLQQRGIEHVVFEKAAQAGEAWRNHRWDSFTLVTPNWSFCLPGAEYREGDPDGFMPRVEIVERFEHYVDHFHLPVQYQTQVTSVEPLDGDSGYLVQTQDKKVRARNVVIATGLYQADKVPVFASGIPMGIKQLPSSQYRNPESLPPGAVLVVGSAQSGGQIAEELQQSGRTVYLCVGSAGHVPRRYRGRDIYDWLNRSGFIDRTEAALPSPKMKFAGNPLLSGKNGGHALNLHRFARDGIVLLGRLQDVQNGKIRLATDLKENLAKVDKFQAEALKMVDTYIEKNALDAPTEHLPELRDGYDVEIIEQLDLKSAGINTVVWTTGYAFDFRMIKLPVLDADGFPIQKGGVTNYPGLSFIGLPWLPKQKTGQLIGVGEHAAAIASEIAGRGK
jgi:putative flavoprotein involved in K+ transport